MSPHLLWYLNFYYDLYVHQTLPNFFMDAPLDVKILSKEISNFFLHDSFYKQIIE